MDTRQITSKLINATLSTIRGPVFLSVLSGVLLLAAIPAEATLLRGYIRHDAQTVPQSASSALDRHGFIQEQNTVAGPEPDEAQAKSTDSSIDSTINTAAGTPLAGAYDSTQYGTPAIPPAQAQTSTSRELMQTAMTTAAHSFPITYEGTWKVLTVVTDSAVPNVPIGQRLESQVTFIPQRDGRVVAHWEQNGWAESEENINAVSTVEATMERTNYFMDGGASGGWTAHSSDLYIQIAPNRISATSSVDQYESGQYLGQYRTRSMLYRVGNHIAMVPQR